MDRKSINVDGSAVRIATCNPLSVEEIDSLFGKYGEIKRIIFEDGHQMIYFQSENDAKHCAQNFSTDEESLPGRIAEADPDPDSTGDTILKSDQNSDWKSSKKVNKNSSTIKAAEKKEEHVKSASVDPFLQNCSSPVLLNTMDPGFRLAYCHNVSAPKPDDTKSRRLHQFNRSIKKYMESTPKVGSQELVITNLPPNFKKEDVYQLCGKIEPETVELKMTSNINVLYANIKAKSKDDFEKLTEVLGNRQVNGTRITTIPITKISQEPSTDE